MEPTEHIQSRRDRTLRAELSDDRGVKLALRKLDDRWSGYGIRTRRELLSGALRLSRSIAPDAVSALAECRERLGMKQSIELYVKQDPRMGAFCARSEAGPYIVCLHSRLLETFSPAELRFVLGHELGHVLFDHFAIPMPAAAVVEDVGGKFVDRAVQLKLYLWCRAAEISADRAGLVCAQEADACTHALLKLASGMASGIHPDLSTFTAQLDLLIAAPGACANERNEEEILDCFNTHPYSPLRVRTILAFARSAAFARAGGRAATGLSDDELEDFVERELSIMEPSYLEDTGEDAVLMRRVLYCAGLCVAAANGVIADSEVAALKALLGAKQVDMTVKPEAVRAELADKMREASTRIGFARRVQLVQHATIIAAADGLVEPSELEELSALAAGLGVDPSVIQETLHGAAAPMD